MTVYDYAKRRGSKKIAENLKSLGAKSAGGLEK